MSNPMIQTSDGRWVPVRPIPYFRDTRPFYVKIWHVLLAIRGCCIKNKYKREAYEDRLDERTDKWMVPVEEYTDKKGRWRRW